MKSVLTVLNPQHFLDQSSRDIEPISTGPAHLLYGYVLIYITNIAIAVISKAYPIVQMLHG